VIPSLLAELPDILLIGLLHLTFLAMWKHGIVWNGR
jgi:hypothetical protein